MASNSPAIATMTRARNEVEASLLFDSLEELSRFGLPVYVTDAGSIPQFVNAISKLHNFVLAHESGGLVAQVKTSLRNAATAGHDLIVYTEPDKKDFFASHLREFVDHALAHPDAAVSIAARDAQGFSTFPGSQRSVEQAFNRLASELAIPMPDLLYGPLALNARGSLDCADRAPNHLGWGWRIYAIVRCALAGREIASFERPFSCPASQRDLDEGLYRLEQLAQNVEGLRLAMRDFRTLAN